jgi:uncharacterized protein (TIGR02466 family)
MERINLFTIPVWTIKVPDDIDTEWLVNWAYDLKNQGDGKLNEFNAWQSFDNKGDMRFTLPIPQGIKVQQWLDETMWAIADEIELDEKPNLLNYWFNINPPKGFNNWHKHRNVMLVANLYLRTPENSGGIELIRDDEAQYYISVEQKANEVLGTRKVINAKERELVVFPGWLAHEVKGNQSNEDRVSMSFNYGAIK